MAYDRSIRMYDESHAPEELDRIVSGKTVNKGKFLSEAHGESYLVQMREIRKLKDVASVLEVGPGEAFCAGNLRGLGYEYHTLDFESAHQPTYQADFKTLDPRTLGRLYDMTCAFQVLEHFPYEDFANRLRTLAAIARKYVFLSLPYSCRGWGFQVNVHEGQNENSVKRFHFYRPSGLPNRKYRPEYMEEFPWAVHYWEIGREGFPLERILGDVEAAGLRVLDQFHAPNPYHYFILCRKRDSAR